MLLSIQGSILGKIGPTLTSINDSATKGSVQRVLCTAPPFGFGFGMLKHTGVIQDPYATVRGCKRHHCITAFLRLAYFRSFNIHSMNIL